MVRVKPDETEVNPEEEGAAAIANPPPGDLGFYYNASFINVR
jgi:hypothetical protein